MEYELEGTSSELIASEQLQSFSVIDRYCNDCDRMTPHHIDESAPQLNKADTGIQKPISIHECVLCREEEENRLDL